MAHDVPLGATMGEPRKPIFDVIKSARAGRRFSLAEVQLVDETLDQLGIPSIAETAPTSAPAQTPGAAPRWFALAKSLIGTREVVGPKHSATILGWAAKLGAKVLGIAVKDDETPWCGTFVAHVMVESGIAPPPIAVRASSWASWGRELIGPRLGCVLVFTREGGGHVGLYAGERSDAYRVLGGNQSNAVTETWIAKDRLAKGGIRWPTAEPMPMGGRIMLANGGALLSKNEA